LVPGSYQPSHELQLRFYAYYKQATEGPNYHPKPNFWEVVKRAKWDAWAKLGNMTKEEAMMHYVEELKKVSLELRICYPVSIHIKILSVVLLHNDLFKTYNS
jgi:acyl-CoA-binding protein